MKAHWFQILVALAEGPSYGAEIQRRVNERSSGRVRLYPVTLYRSLDQLAEKGFIVELPPEDERDHNEKRRSYQITPEGRTALADEADILEAAARHANTVLRRS